MQFGNSVTVKKKVFLDSLACKFDKKGGIDSRTFCWLWFPLDESFGKYCLLTLPVRTLCRRRHDFFPSWAF